MQIRCLLEGVTPQEMLQTWHDMLPEYMQRWGLDRGEVRPGGGGSLQLLPLCCLQLAVSLVANAAHPCGVHVRFLLSIHRTSLHAPAPAAAQLVDLFGSTRDEWMAADLDGWLAPNRIYPGVAEAMQALMQQHEVYIVTTKQASGGAHAR